MAEIIIEAIATNNLVSRNGGRIPASELPALAGYLIGKKAITDHRWTVYPLPPWGYIQSSEVLTLPPPDDIRDVDKDIIVREGYQVIKVAIAADDQHPYVKDRGYIDGVSIAFEYTTMGCANCECERHDIFHPKCPNSFWDIEYYERWGIVDAFEISLVVIPAVRQASLL